MKQKQKQFFSFYFHKSPLKDVSQIIVTKILKVFKNCLLFWKIKKKIPKLTNTWIKFNYTFYLCHQNL